MPSVSEPVLAPILLDAWALFRRDRDWLLRLAAPFLFLPAFALALLVPPIPAPSGDASQDRETRALAWAQELSQWIGANGHWHLLAYAVGYVGVAAILSAYIDRRSGTVGGALLRVSLLMPRYWLAMLLVALPAGAGMLLYILPGLYILGRTMLVGPVIVAERPTGALGGVGRSFGLTRGVGLPMMALAALVWAGGALVALPFATMAASFAEAETPSVLLLAIADAGVAGAALLAGLAQALVAVAAYRRLVAR
jgi:hypothetical protein